LLPALALSACLSGGGKPDGLGRVDDLRSSIADVKKEGSLARERVQAATTRLEELTRGQFEGTAVDAYKRFTSAWEASQEQAASLADRLEPMRAAAEPLFEDWASNLEAFESESMRRHSEQRLQEAKRLYESVLKSAEQASSSCETYNRALRDHAIYLSQDLSPAAIAQIQGEVAELVQRATKLDGELTRCGELADAYIAATELPIAGAQPEKRTVKKTTDTVPHRAPGLAEPAK